MNHELATLKEALRLDPENPFLIGHVQALESTTAANLPPQKNAIWLRWRTSFQHGSPAILPCDNCGLITRTESWSWSRQTARQLPLELCPHCLQHANTWQERQTKRGNVANIFATTPVATDTLESAIVPPPAPHPCHCDGSRKVYHPPQLLEADLYCELVRCRACNRTYVIQSEPHTAIKLAKALNTEPLKSELADIHRQEGDFL